MEKEYGYPSVGFKKDQLLKYSKEHLYYELWMLLKTAERIPTFRSKKDNNEVAQVEYNAILESFLTHARNLIEFFYHEKRGKKSVENDLRAWDFLDKPSEWNLTPYKDAEDVFNRTSQEVAHLTKERKALEKEKIWLVHQVLKIIETPFEKFISMASRDKLDSKVKSISISTVRKHFENNYLSLGNQSSLNKGLKMECKHNGDCDSTASHGPTIPPPK